MKFFKNAILISGAILALQSLSAQPTKIYLVSPAKVAAIKSRAENDKKIKANISQLAKQADKLLEQHFGSVMDKKYIPPCGNMHEYTSLAKYFWPDSSKPDGKPYIRKDGEKNPEVDLVSDDKNFDELIGAVHTLSWAYYFTGEEKYAQKATALIRFWFLDTATRMLPNLNHAQMTTGADTGRGSGIIDTHNLPWIVDAIGLLQSSTSWKAGDESGMQQWFSAYLNWLTTSKNGRHESKVGNNHKTFYENQVAAIALYCGKKEVAGKVFSNAKNLITSQVEPDGRQPEELVRTLALGYSTFNLQAWFLLANVAETQGIDLWHYETKDDKSIRKALDYLLPYALNEKPWTYPQIHPYKTKDFYSLLLQAAEKFNNDDYRKQAEKIKESNSNILVKILYEQ